jgi:uncharacterized protein (TIGR02145 family)
MDKNNTQKLSLRHKTSLVNVSNQISITNKILASITDKQFPVFSVFTDPRDGNVYKTVKIGEQVWMAENLRYIPHVCLSKEQGGIWVYGYYGHDINEAIYTKNYKEYGCLYDWETAKLVSPSGWHLPYQSEWNKMLDFHGSADEAGGKLKSKTGWANPNTGATNECGFSGLPGGFRFNHGTFFGIGTHGYWWAFTDEGSFDKAWSQNLYHSDTDVRSDGSDKKNGHSVRCIKEIFIKNETFNNKSS